MVGAKGEGAGDDGKEVMVLVAELPEGVEDPGLEIMFSVKDKRLGVSTHGRQRMKWQEMYVS